MERFTQDKLKYRSKNKRTEGENAECKEDEVKNVWQNTRRDNTFVKRGIEIMENLKDM